MSLFAKSRDYRNSPSGILQRKCPGSSGRRIFWKLYFRFLAIYPPNIYDLFDGPDEVRDFMVGFIANKSKNMSSLYTMMLTCVLFRPSLMSESDFKVLKKGLAYFESKYLCFQCGGIKNLIP